MFVFAPRVAAARSVRRCSPEALIAFFKWTDSVVELERRTEPHKTGTPGSKSVDTLEEAGRAVDRAEFEAQGTGSVPAPKPVADWLDSGLARAEAQVHSLSQDMKKLIPDFAEVRACVRTHAYGGGAGRVCMGCG